MIDHNGAIKVKQIYLIKTFLAFSVYRLRSL
jgi:hypothetical protein